VNRLDKIIARNRPVPWYRDKLILTFIGAGVVVMMLVLAATTGLGRPAHDDAPPAPTGPATRVPGVLLKR
jgi:hypothetical protein